MQLTRREFIKSSLALGLVPAVLWPTHVVSEAAKYDFLAHSSPSTFAPLVGSVFCLQTRLTPLDLDLVQVTPSEVLAAIESFSLLFRGAPGLESNTYPVSHPQLGNFYLFLSPVGALNSPASYEAVFTRYTGSRRA